MKPERFDHGEEIGLCTSVAVGNECIGSFVNCGELGVEVYASNALLGMLADEDVAETTLLDRWYAKRQSNGGDAPLAVGEEPGLQPGPARAGDAPATGAQPQSLAAASPILAAALDLARQRGWKVFPARMEDGKKWSWLSAKYAPGGENWGMTRDPEQLRHNFLNAKWRFKCGVGVPTGVENRIFVVETDTKEGHNVDGDAALAELEQKHGKLPDTLMAGSPSGSKHRYFEWPEGIEIRNSTSAIGPGIDVRGEGGMVIAPPSVREDGEYRWLNDNDITRAPQWLIDLAVAASGNSKAKPNDGRPVPSRELEQLGPVPGAFRHLPLVRLGAGIEHPAADIEEIRSAFAVIPNDDRGWDDWNKCGLALFRATAGSDEGLAVFHAWSSKSKKYKAQATADRWAAYKTCPPDRIGAGSIFHWANEASPGFTLQWEQERRAEQIAENIKIGDDVTEPTLPQIMTLKEMHERLVFIGSTGAVADCATGRIRKKEYAADEYAASKHTYTTEKNGKIKQEGGPALKFWIASKDRVTVEVLAWVPGAPQICQPPEGQGPAFNMWRGLSPMAYPEDWRMRAEPFLEHVEYLVPIAEERERFLQWLPHIVRRPEVLPHTGYLMTTPTTGIGRNLLASILVRALRGFVAAGISLPDLLDGGFTGRLSRKLLAIVDEAREGSGERRYQRATRLTSLLNEEHRHINPKYGHQSIEKNCCRWLMFSNHDDAIPFDNSDRRVIVIANPTTRKEDAYYERLYGLLNDNAFIGSVRHWLETKDITGFRPGEHAPMNQAKLRVLNEMMSETERAVAEFKEDCGTELTSRDAIKDHVLHTITRTGRLPATANDTHLTHAIKRAGMLNTGRRIMAYRTDRHAIGDHEDRFTVVIVRGEWTTEIVKRADSGKILEVMGLKDWSTVKPQR